MNRRIDAEHGPRFDIEMGWRGTTGQKGMEYNLGAAWRFHYGSIQYARLLSSASVLTVLGH